MNVTLRDAIITVCKRIKEGFVIDEAELSYLRQELKKITGTVKNSGDHLLFMDFFNLAASCHSNGQLRSQVYRSNLTDTPSVDYGLLDSGKENIAPNKVREEIKSYSNQTKVNLLLKTSRELLELFESVPPEVKFDELDLASKDGEIFAKFRLMFGLVENMNWQNKKDRVLVEDELSKIYRSLTWEASDRNAKSLNPVQLLVNQLDAIFNSAAPRKPVFMSSGKYLPQHGMFAQTSGVPAPTAQAKTAKAATTTNVVAMQRRKF